jgi:hypothetical protein
MTSPKIARRTAACAVLAAAAVFAPVSASQAGVDPNCNPDRGSCAFKFDNVYPIDDVIPIDGCAAQFGTSATTIGTGEESGGGNYSNVPSNPFFHFHETTTENTRITFPSGYYALDTFSSHLTYTSGSHPPVLTFSQPVQERATVYTPDGEPSGVVVKIHALSHFTWRDMDGNGDPTPGDDYLSSVDNLRMTCS